VDSSIAYQVYGRGLEVEPVAAWNAYIVSGLTPSRTYFLSLAAEDATFRLARQLQLWNDADQPPPPDRLERESLEFRRRVQEGYERLAERFQERIVIIDAYRRPREIKASIREDLGALMALELQPELIRT
jgi:dTMP kinase